MKRKTRYVLLGLLLDESMTGYELKKKIDLEMQFFWKESYGQLYPELHTMLAEGLLCICTHEGKGDAHKEKIRYKITEAGRAAFRRWMAEDNQTDSIRSELLLKVFLATDDHADTLQCHIKQYRRQLQDKLELFALFQQNLMAHTDLHPNHKYNLQVLELGIKQSELYSDWCAQLLAQLVNGRLKTAQAAHE